MKKDSASIDNYVEFLFSANRNAIGVDLRNNKYVWPTVRAMAKVRKPVDGCIIICDEAMEEGVARTSGIDTRMTWGEEMTLDSYGHPIYSRRYIVNLNKPDDITIYGHRYLIYSANEDKLYLGDFYSFRPEYVPLVSGISRENVLPIDKSKFVGLELSEKAFLGLEEPVLHYLGKSSLKEANAYVAQIQRKFDDKIQAENAQDEARREAKIKAHYANLTRKYGQKAVNAMLNDQPYVGMPAGILREGIKTDGVFVLSSGWKITSSYGGRTVYSKGRRRCLAINGVVKSVYTE